MKEIWKDIQGYEKLYQVSNFGKIKSLPKKTKMKNQYTEKEMILKPTKNRYGYYYVDLCNGKNNKKKYLIHQLVAKAFIPNPESKPQVNHKNGIKTDNTLNNLEWCTAKENNIHAIKNGLRKIKAVLQYDKQGNFIKEWECVADTNLKHIYEVCNGQRKSAGGFIWAYKENIKDMDIKKK